MTRKFSEGIRPVSAETASMGYTYLAISVLCMTILGVSYKLSDRANCCQPHVNFFMFFFAAVGMLAWGWTAHRFVSTPTAVALGVMLGLNLFVSVRAFREAVAKGRLSTSWTILQLSMVFPVLASVLIWGEHPDLKRCLGLALTAVAIVLLGVDMARSQE